MTNTAQDLKIDYIIDALRKSHARTTQGNWAMGSLINETVSRTIHGDTDVAKFRRTDDAHFCDLAHAFLPRVLDEYKSLQDQVLDLTQKLKDHEHSEHGEQEKKTPMIVNLTQHLASADQLRAGVVDLPEHRRRALLEALTFDEIPSSQQIVEAAEQIVRIALDNGLDEDGINPVPEFAMIAGAPWLMSTLEKGLRLCDITPVHAFSAREIKETVEPDGSIKKISVFRHKGFVYS